FDQGFSWGDITTKGNELYLHVFDLPAEGMLRLADLGANVTGASLLHDSSTVAYQQKGTVLEVNLGSQVGREMPLIPVVKLTLDGPVQVSNQATQIDGITTATLLAEMSTVEDCAIEESRWMEKFGEWKHDYYVEEWQSEDAKAVWDLNVLAAGEYLVSIEYSAENDAADSEWVLSCGDESITFVSFESGFDSNKSF
ncbi:hypothetical protein QEH59_18715, partial [Coraliomargarita sp. SDUM461004]